MSFYSSATHPMLSKILDFLFATHHSMILLSKLQLTRQIFAWLNACMPSAILLLETSQIVIELTLEPVSD